MSSTIFFFIFIPLLAIILLAVNLIFAPHNPYQEKDSAFECGFHSFLGQNRTQFSISFFIFALLFLLFDLEILLVYPYVVSAYTNSIYGLVVMLIFFLALTLGFAFELGKNALKIDSRQMLTFSNNYTNTTTLISGFSHLASFLPSLVLAGQSTAEASEVESKKKELEKQTRELEENRVERKKVDEQNSHDGDTDSPNEEASLEELIS
jgi:NADH-ubiquinone oxidoreductase chain 3